MKIIKLWFHCWLHLHRMGSYDLPKRHHDYCADCDYLNDDHSRIVKKIRAHAFDDNKPWFCTECGKYSNYKAGDIFYCEEHWDQYLESL